MIAAVFPGQGAQRRGMGRDGFVRHRQLLAIADELLGYSVERLCLDDPQGRLARTLYTQPAMFVVNAMHWLDARERGLEPRMLAGHSLGEYSALWAAEVISFADALRLVQRRAELMDQAADGGMAAIIGLDAETVAAALRESNAEAVDIANYNAPAQIVISGARLDIERLKPLFERRGARAYAILNVSAAFHSRAMQPAARRFAEFLTGFELRTPQLPVVANFSARPHAPNTLAPLLSQQITGPVRWTESINYMLDHGVREFVECGPGDVLTKMIGHIRAARSSAPSSASAGNPTTPNPTTPNPATPNPATPNPTTPNPATPNPTISQAQHSPLPPTTAARVSPSDPQARLDAGALGSQAFRTAHRVRYAYASGSMYKGIASPQLVIRMGEARLLSFLGCGGMSLAEIDAAIDTIQARLGRDGIYGVNLLAHADESARELQEVELFLRKGVHTIEASAFMQITPALVWFRLRGVQRDADGRLRAPNRIVAKLSRPEIAQLFLGPAPEAIVSALVREGRLSASEAALSRELPLAHDLCVEADSGGHTDMGQLATLLPAIIRLRDEAMARHGYHERIRVGAAGGIGTPNAAMAAFMLGADFIVTGSINQCTPEAGTSDRVKTILASLDVSDTDYAPAGDMFEIGSRVQVVRKGLLFPVRANRLYDLYRMHARLEDIDVATLQRIERSYFQRSFDEVLAETRSWYSAHRPEQLARAEANPKQRMALLFKWYFVHSSRLALTGAAEQLPDYQIHCGPAMGAFNHWVRGTALEAWTNRHVDVIAEQLMTATTKLLVERVHALPWVRAPW